MQVLHRLPPGRRLNTTNLDFQTQSLHVSSVFSLWAGGGWWIEFAEKLSSFY